MSWGAGFGLPFGGGAPAPLESPESVIGDDPVTFDFTDEPDGPLPGQWETYEYTQTAGAVSSQAEPNPDTYYRIVNGLAQWRYLRQPAVGDPFVERGVAAGPVGVLAGRNAEVAVAFVQPTDLLNPLADEFVLELTVGLRASDDTTAYIGARVRAAWAAGAWTTPVAFELVQAAGVEPPTVLASATFDPGTDPLNLWRVGTLGEVRVTVRDDELTGVLSGSLAKLTATVGRTSSKPAIVARIYNRTGALFDPPPALAGVQLLTLRDPDRLGPPPAIDGAHLDLESPQLPIMRLPLLDLFQQGLVRRHGGRVFEFTPFEGDDGVEVDALGIKQVFPAGTRVRAIERVEQQTFIPVVNDLAHIRGLKEREV